MKKLSDVVKESAESSESSGSEDESDSSNSSSDKESQSDSGSESDGSSPEQIIHKFSYHLAHERAVTLQKNYICHMCGSDSVDQIATASSDFTSSLYSVDNLQNIRTFEGHTKSITNLRFNPNDPNQLITSSLDGTIKFWDTRKAGKSALTFKDDTAESGQLKPFLSFDVSKSGHFLCAGTEVFEGDAFLVFGDARTAKVLGGYWESHSDDITQVAFHPFLSDSVASGSSDGLINIYDLKSGTEDDALVNCINTESTVDKLTWYKIGGAFKGLSCILDTMDLQLWGQDDVSPSVTFSRMDVSKCTGWISRQSYIINVHQAESGDLLCIVGNSTKSSENLALLKVKDKKLHLESGLPGNKQRVRCSWLNAQDGTLITAGENGILSLWKPGAEAGTSNSAKILPKQTSSRVRPY